MALFSTKPNNFLFKYNMEQVYKCFVCYNITTFLKKRGLLNFVDFTPINANELPFKEIFVDKLGLNVVLNYLGQEYQSIVEEVKNESNFRQFKFSFKSTKGKSLGFTFNFVFQFYAITDTNSTLASFFIECSEKARLRAIAYDKSYKEPVQITVCKDIDHYLKKWCKPDLLMDSILINTSADKLFKEIISSSIFLKLPFFKGLRLVVKRKEGIVGSSYTYFDKGKAKRTYTIKSIEETNEFINLIYQKKNCNTSLGDQEFQVILVKLDKDHSMIQLYTKLNFTLDGYHLNILKEFQQNEIRTFKKLYEKQHLSS